MPLGLFWEVFLEVISSAVYVDNPFIWFLPCPLALHAAVEVIQRGSGRRDPQGETEKDVCDVMVSIE